MLQSRRQDLEAQIRGLREELEKGRGRLQATHEELLLLRRERREHTLEVTGRAGVGGHVRLGAWATASGPPGRRPQSWVTGSPSSLARRAKALAQGQVGATERLSGVVVLGCIRDQQLEARDGAEARAHRWR